jgi:hypothetical protein
VNWACSTSSRSENSVKFLIRKLDGKKLLWRPRHRCKDNMEVDLK